MSLTPLDIQHKEFESKFKGYSKDEVDDFLDLIKKNYEQVLKENKDLEKKVKFAEEKIEHFQNLQDALNKSIVVAQDAADRLKENARKEAEIILFEAEKSADRLLKEAAEKATQINHETDNVRRESRNFKQKLQVLVESQLNLIKNEEWELVLNTVPEKYVPTPTLDDVLNNRTRKVDDLMAETGFETTESSEKDEQSEEGQVEAIDISVENK